MVKLEILEKMSINLFFIPLVNCLICICLHVSCFGVPVHVCKNIHLYFLYIFCLRQFAQFDYGQQGYGDPNAYGGQKDQYMGSIMTPDPVAQYNQNGGGENYDEEPPLMEGMSF